MPSDPLDKFMTKIGWSRYALSEFDTHENNREHLLGLKSMYERRYAWPIMGIGQQICSETGERYSAVARSCAGPSGLWHIYERAQLRADRPTYKVSFSPDRKNWHDVGYFNRWSRRWKKPEKGLVHQLIMLVLKIRYRKKLKEIDEMVDQVK